MPLKTILPKLLKFKTFLFKLNVEKCSSGPSQEWALPPHFNKQKESR